MVLSDETAPNYELRDPDVQLMLQVRQDNIAAFEELVRRYQGRLITVVKKLVQKPDLAEDLVQEVFLRVFRSRKTYEPVAKFSTWLFTIANNVARNSLRSLARRREIYISPGRDRVPAPAPPSQIAQDDSGIMPTRLLDRTERVEMVQQAILSLSERQRVALLLSRFEGMSYNEIGDTMELSSQAVKSLLTRARSNLRVALEPYMKDGRCPKPRKPRRVKRSTRGQVGHGDLVAHRMPAGQKRSVANCQRDRQRTRAPHS